MKGLARSTDWVEAVAAYGEYVFGYQPAAHHIEMIRHIADSILRRENSVTLEPRGAAKTTWGNTIFLSWLACTFPDIRIGLISNTSTQAFDFSRAIRFTLASNAKHREIFGECVSSEKWTNMEWLHRESKWHGSKDVTMFAVGAEGAVISKRFDLLFCDDILDEENTATPEAREKVETWFFKTLLPCLEKGGVVVILGTRWAADDLYEKLMRPTHEEEGRGWASKVVSALQGDVEQGEGLVSYWPEHWSVADLQSKRTEIGTPLFMCAYQNDIEGLLAGNVFQKRHFKYFKDFIMQGHTTFMGVDLASSEKERADYTARVTTSRDPEGNYYVHSYYQDRRETGHAEFIADGFRAWAPDLVIVENQQFQSTLVQEVMRDYPRIPIEGKPSDVDKTTRARAVAAKFEAGKVFLHESLRDSDLTRQLLAFPKGHDDLVDALGFSFDLGGDGFFYGSLRR